MALQLALLLLLFSLSAFFSASETALFSLRRHDRKWLEQHATRAARCALELLGQPHSLLVAVLFGNLVVNFLLMGVSARVVLAFSSQGVAGVIAGFLLTTFSVVVLGEVTPKAVAVTAPRRVALLTAPLLLLFRDATRRLTRPLERLVSGSLDLLERRLPRPGALTDQELKRFAELHGAEGSLERQASLFLAQALELRSRRANEILTPRVDLVAIDLSSPTAREELFALARERSYGKMLVHDGEGLDRIHGYLRMRDVLRAPADQPLAELVRPLWFVPGTKTLESLLREMVERRAQLALVVDEYGGTSGLITLEDLVEEITGDIAREEAPPLLRPGDGGRWVLQGRFPLREAEDLLGIRFSDAGTTTLGGFVAHELGRIPEVGDVVWHSGVQLRVRELDRRRVSEVEVALPRPGQRAPRGEVSEEMTHSGAIRARERMAEWAANRGALPDSGERPGAAELGVAPAVATRPAPEPEPASPPAQRDPFGSDDTTGEPEDPDAGLAEPAAGEPAAGEPAAEEPTPERAGSRGPGGAA
ncbi:MAG: hemolysin family protein [Planctomycetota bacterium]